VCTGALQYNYDLFRYGSENGFNVLAVGVQQYLLNMLHIVTGTTAVGERQ
jgi:hypothetical protein